MMKLIQLFNTLFLALFLNDVHHHFGFLYSLQTLKNSLEVQCTVYLSFKKLHISQQQQQLCPTFELQTEIQYKPQKLNRLELFSQNILDLLGQGPAISRSDQIYPLKCQDQRFLSKTLLFNMTLVFQITRQLL